MTEFIKKEDKALREHYYTAKLDSGLKITVIPKDFPNIFAMLCCDFGGVDIEYEVKGEKFTLPTGTAHFLEHKMFENPDGSDAFSEFDNFGGSANAFTSYENTCYYFSCTDNFSENLEILLRSVSGLYITEDSVEKEKKIIAREIVMYEDMPTSNVARNLCKSLYHTHPTIYPIAGTLDSISEISAETLHRAYNHFYTPENLNLCICGNVSPEEVAAMAERFFGKCGQPRPKTIFGAEPLQVKTNKIEENSAIATPIFSIGIKCPPPESNDISAYRRGAAMRIAISLTFGRAGDFYCRNYEKGLLSERFYAGFTQSRSAAHVLISGSSNQPEAVFELVKKELEYRKTHFFTDEQVIREKRAAFAECLTLFDSGDDITASFATDSSLPYDEYDCIAVLRDITEEEIRNALNSLDLENSAISIVRKKGENQ